MWRLRMRDAGMRTLPSMERPQQEGRSLMAAITKQQFMAYERVRKARRHNMFTDGHSAAEAAGLSWETFLDIQESYNDLDKKWPEVRGGLRFQ
jgi:hypothetical protein